MAGNQELSRCGEELVGNITCNPLGRWKPEQPDTFTCGQETTTSSSTTTTTSTSTSTSTSNSPSTTTATSSTSPPGEECEEGAWLSPGTAPPTDCGGSIGWDGSLVPDCGQLSALYHAHEYSE